MMLYLFSILASVASSLILFEDKQMAILGSICIGAATMASFAYSTSKSNEKKLDLLLKKSGLTDKEIEKI